jgi:hypothetical protein
MGRNSTGRRSSKAAATSGRAETAQSSVGTKLDRLLKAGTIDPFYAAALRSGAAKIELLTDKEVDALISAHKKLSPKKRFQPDPDGSIF